MKVPTGVRLQTKRRVIALSAVMSGLACVLSLPVHNIAQTQSAENKELMYVLETKATSTFEVGKIGDINIVLKNKYGKPELAGHNRTLTITATTLDTLDAAKKVLPPRKQVKSKPFDDNKLVLGRGQKAVQITIKHESNEDDKDVHLLSYQPGLIHIFAESGDRDVATGDTVVVVREPGRSRVKAGLESSPDQIWPDQIWPGQIRLAPIVWQGGDAKRLRLEIMPLKPIIKTQNGEQLAYFKVALKSATSDEFIDAPYDVKVVLEVLEGYARFDPDMLRIPKDDMISPDAASLRTKPGGSITIRASAGNAEGYTIQPDQRPPYEFQPGPHTTNLRVDLQRDGAIANGLDEVELIVSARQDETLMRPEDEGMDERVITFRLVGDARGVRFENGNSEVRIPKGQEKGKIKLFGTRPVSDMKVVAETYNGLNQLVTTKDNPTPIRFSFPWFQLLCATLGGAVFPLLWRQTKTQVLTGLVLGAVFFGLALFGAIASDPQNLGTFSMTVAKLPTENFFASFILGLIGSVLIGVAFKRYFGAVAEGPSSETHSIDATPAQSQSKRVSASNDRENSASPLKPNNDFVD